MNYPPTHHHHDKNNVNVNQNIKINESTPLLNDPSNKKIKEVERGRFHDPPHDLSHYFVPYWKFW